MRAGCLCDMNKSLLSCERKIIRGQLPTKEVVRIKGNTVLEEIKDIACCPMLATILILV